MAGTPGGNSADLWSDNGNRLQPQVEEGIYRRRRPPQQINPDIPSKPLSGTGSRKSNRVSLAAPHAKRISWNRSLSTRGRTSIAVGACTDHGHQIQPKHRKRKGKPALPKGKCAETSNFEKERAYFQEVDAFELLEESPSPKNFGTWIRGYQFDIVAIPPLASRLEKWFISKRLHQSVAPSSTLSKILETPSMPLEPSPVSHFYSNDLKTPEKSATKKDSHLLSIQSRSSLTDNNVLEGDGNSEKRNTALKDDGRDGLDNIEDEVVKKLSLASHSVSQDHDHVNPFDTLLAVCGQSTPAKLKEVFSKYCEPEKIVKIGEGTYGEAFKVGSCVCKVVPIDGDLRVNGEVQKRSGELLEEVILSRTLNCLRQDEGDAQNLCTIFIETLDIKVCRGVYDASLIQAWEDWDEKHGSENDHPKEFPEKQDLESFVLLNFEEARSLLVQVTAALAVAEAAYEFEHRDLHWGNILLSRSDLVSLQFTLEGKQKTIKTFGLFVSIIDFTLSRINTGEDILFLDLSSDPYLFKGPKGDRQAETYRRMKEVTEDSWEGSFPRTNVLWLLYLVDILLVKKAFERSSSHERDLRSLKKRLEKYESAKEAILDAFFSDLISDHNM